jgi:hypothetical protein
MGLPISELMTPFCTITKPHSATSTTDAALFQKKICNNEIVQDYLHPSTYVQTWVHKCVIKRAGCGKSNKYMHTNLHCKILQTSYKDIINCTHKIFIYRVKGVCLYVGIFLQLH